MILNEKTRLGTIQHKIAPHHVTLHHVTSYQSAMIKTTNRQAQGSQSGVRVVPRSCDADVQCQNTRTDKNVELRSIMESVSSRRQASTTNLKAQGEVNFTVNSQEASQSPCAPSHEGLDGILALASRPSRRWLSSQKRRTAQIQASESVLHTDLDLKTTN